MNGSSVEVRRLALLEELATIGNLEILLTMVHVSIRRSRQIAAMTVIKIRLTAIVPKRKSRQKLLAHLSVHRTSGAFVPRLKLHVQGLINSATFLIMAVRV